VCAVRAPLGVIRLTSGACLDLRQSSCTPRGLPRPGKCPQQRQDCRDADRRSEAGAESLGRPEAPAGGEYGDGDRDPGHPTEKAQHVEGAGCFPDLSLRNRAQHGVLAAGAKPPGRFQKKFGLARRILCDQHRRIVAYSVPNWRSSSSRDRAVVDPMSCRLGA